MVIAHKIVAVILRHRNGDSPEAKRLFIPKSRAFAIQASHIYIRTTYNRILFSLCYRDHFVYARSKWETTLHCNVVSHWLGAYTKWSLCYSYAFSMFRWKSYAWRVSYGWSKCICWRKGHRSFGLLLCIIRIIMILYDTHSSIRPST